MSYSSESKKYGRIPTVFVELDMDFCANSYGIAPCTASIGVTGTSKCYNTYATCQNKANFNKIIKTYRFCEQNADLPVGLSAIPLLKSVSFASQEITPNKGLGVRGSVSISFIDAPWPDTEIDPYFAERTNQGTFWGKFKARNPFYENRVLRVRRGYLTKNGFDWANFVNSVYVIEQLQGIAKDDSVKIVAKDILKLADDKKALFPKPSNGRLSANIDAIQTSFTLTPSGVGSQYKTSGKLAISGEMMSYTRSGDTFTVVRGVNNTQAEAHNADDTVQEVGIIYRQRVQNVIYDFLTNYAGISTSYINKTEWDTEANTYLPGLFSAEIPEPTGINTLIGELTEQGTCRIWWDEIAQKIQFRAIKPLPPNLPVLTDESHFLSKSIDVKTDNNQRISTVLVYFAQRKQTEKLDDLKNYALRVATPDLNAISNFEYGSNIVKKVFSRWFKNSSQGRVNALADALLKTYRDPPQLIEFNLTPALQLKVGDLFYAQTRKIQDVTGGIASVPMEVIFAQPTDRDDIKYKAQQVSTAIPIANTFEIILSDEFYWDVNILDMFMAEYGTPSPNIKVEVKILTGVFVSASTTANYALTVGNAWPANVTILINNSGIIAGRGGNGGRGGRAFYDDPRHDPMYLEYYGGNRANPSSVVHGKKGGNAILVNHAVIILNAGIISVGGGGGGASGGAVAGNDGGGVVFYGRTQSGSGGGGGWPFGTGGNAGQMNYDDTIFTDHTYMVGGRTYNQQVGNVGETATKFIAVSYGGNPRLNSGSAYFFAETHTAGDGGCPVLATLATNGGDSQAAGDIGYIYAGDGGNAGANGDYAINGNSLITWISTGLIYGSII